MWAAKSEPKRKMPLFEKSGAKTFYHSGPVAMKPARAKGRRRSVGMIQYHATRAGFMPAIDFAH
jgi:hypothetical protein